MFATVSVTQAIGVSTFEQNILRRTEILIVLDLFLCLVNIAGFILMNVHINAGFVIYDSV